METNDLITQTNNSFDFIQKLYLETSFLIKEIEGILAIEKEEFIVNRPSGYMVCAPSSNGLESSQVCLWMYSKVSVFFVPKTSTKLEKGMTHTLFESNPKFLFFRFIFHDQLLREPTILFGFLDNFTKNNKREWPGKIEHVMNNIETKLENKEGNVLFKDLNYGFSGELISQKLYKINTGEDILKKIVIPALKIYRE